MEYTRGRWATKKNALGTWTIYTIHTRIADVDRHFNALLIAAAPAMYEALEAVDDYLSAPYPENMKLKQIAADKLVSALALARRQND